MATELKLRRDVEADIDAMTPAEGEPIYDITNKRLRVGDGSVAGGLHLLAAADHQKQTFTYALVTGTDTLTASLSPAVASYTTGFKALIEIANNNTGAVTINFDALGAKTIKKNGGADDLAADDLVAGGIYTVIYDGINFQLSTPVGAAAGLVLLATASASASASIIFNSFIDSTYNVYHVTGTLVVPSTDNAQFEMRTSTNGGSTWDQTANDYRQTFIHTSTVDGVTGLDNTVDTSAHLTLGGGVTATNPGSAAGEHLNFELLLFGPSNASNPTHFIWRISYEDSGGNPCFITGMGQRDIAADVDAIQFRFSAGNIASGEFALYGVSKT